MFLFYKRAARPEPAKEISDVDQVKQQATFTNEPVPDNPAPYVQQPMRSWDATQTSRVPPVKVPLPISSSADGDSARQALSQPTARHPPKPRQARKSDTGAKPKAANDKISKLSSMASKAMQERGGVPLEEFKRQRKQRQQNVFRPPGSCSQRCSSPRKRSSSVTGTATSGARVPHSSPEVTSRSVPATSARRPRRPCSSRIPDLPAAPGAAEPILPDPSSCAQTVLGSPPSSPSSNSESDNDPVPGIMLATMESVMLELTPRLQMRRADTQLHEASCALQPMSPPSLMCADQSTVSTADNRFDHAHTDQSAILEDMLLQQVSALLTERSEWSAEKQRLQKEVEQLHELVEYLLDQYEVPAEAQGGGDDDGAESDATVALGDSDATMPIPRIPIESMVETHTIDSVPIFSP
eukprot:jgi/Ulvmu1/274/UM001_0278.1